jgi:outer membrane protein assembly factor BamB
MWGYVWSGPRAVHKSKRHQPKILMNTIKRTMLSISFHACTLAIVLNGALAQDWPQWRGPNRDGKAAAFNAPKTWPAELTQKWKVTVGEGPATPSLAGDKLFVFTRQSGAEIIRCLDAGTGKELWQEKYDALGATGPAAAFSGPRASPAVAEGKVATLGIRGVLSCLEANTGKLLWRKDDFSGAYPRFYAASSPMIVDDLCVAELGGGDKGGVVTYELGSGKEKWRWTGDAPAYSSPVLMTVNGTKLIVAETDGKVVALFLADGKLAWETAFAVQGRGGYNAATPIVDGQTLIYSGSGRGATAVKLEKKGEAFAATDLWKNADNSVVFNSPVLKNGAIYGFSAANDFFCINAQDGKTAWTAPSIPASSAAADAGGGGRGRGMGRGGFGSIVDAGAVLLALSPSSQLIAFEPSDKAYKEVARIKVADTPTHAYPVPSGNRLFIKDQDAVTLWTVP